MYAAVFCVIGSISNIAVSEDFFAKPWCYALRGGDIFQCLDGFLTDNTIFLGKCVMICCKETNADGAAEYAVSNLDVGKWIKNKAPNAERQTFLSIFFFHRQTAGPCSNKIMWGAAQNFKFCCKMYDNAMPFNGSLISFLCDEIDAEHKAAAHWTVFMICEKNMLPFRCRRNM